LVGFEEIKDNAKKKTLLYKERCEVKRAAFLEQISCYQEESIVYIDESGVDSYMHRDFGWAAKGELVMGEVSGKRYARESFIAAKCGPEILAPMCFQGTCDTNLFNFWIEIFLVPILQAGQVVVMDNATFHKSEKTKILIEAAGCTLLFLPPYSPDLNPIEVYWANLKAKIKSLIKDSSTLSEAIDHAFCS
jgi:hypothetical protein